MNPELSNFGSVEETTEPHIRQQAMKGEGEDPLHEALSKGTQENPSRLHSVQLALKKNVL